MSSQKTSIRYEEQPLHIQDLLVDPISQFKIWFDEAKAQGEWDPSAMTLATVNKSYDVSARMLLLKEINEQGFVFYTNYDSPKAQDLESIGNAAMVFWWSTCQRQVRISGHVTRVSQSQSDQYFHSRPIGSQIAAIVSQQSEIIDNREELMSRYQQAERDLSNTSVLTRPKNWGGYILEPNRFEFWQGRVHRLHDRFEYRKFSKGWEIVQLSP